MSLRRHILRGRRGHFDHLLGNGNQAPQGFGKLCSSAPWQCSKTLVELAATGRTYTPIKAPCSQSFRSPEDLILDRIHRGSHGTNKRSHLAPPRYSLGAIATVLEGLSCYP
jgi:hypothetical protein